MSKKSPDPIDVQVGHRIRIERLARGMSQEALARELNLTFQQVQKYEKGTNRVSASRLTRIAEVLGVPVIQLISGDAASRDADPQHQSELLGYLAQPDAVRLLRAFSRMQDRQLRGTFVTLLERVVRGEGTPEQPSA